MARCADVACSINEIAGYSEMSLLSAHNLLAVRGHQQISLPDIRLEAGEKLLLRGESGCGKTTFLSVLAGLLPPQTGQVLCDGTDIYALREGPRNKLRAHKFGFIFQSMHALSALTVMQNLLLAQRLAGQKQDAGAVAHLLQKMRLKADCLHKLPAQLSQGEQQRVAIARALITKPAVLFADEPSSALDDTSAHAVMDLLLAHAREHGTALVVATHDARIVPHFDHVLSLSPLHVPEAA